MHHRINPDCCSYENVTGLVGLRPELPLVGAGDGNGPLLLIIAGGLAGAV